METYTAKYYKQEEEVGSSEFEAKTLRYATVLATKKAFGLRVWTIDLFSNGELVAHRDSKCVWTR